MDHVAGEGRRAKPPTVLITCLGLLAGLSVAGGAVAAVAVLALRKDPEGLPPIAGVLAAACVLGGALIGSGLWGVAWLVRRRSRTAMFQTTTFPSLQPIPPGPAERARPIELSPAGPADAGPPTAPLDWSEYQLLQQILDQLVEINENVLLSPEQREAKRKRRQEELSRRLAEQIGSAIDTGDFARADRQLAELADKLPEDPNRDGLEARLAEARERAKAEDVRNVRRQVEDLMAVGAFDEAEQLALQLQERYPGEDDAAALLERVRREGVKFASERLERLRGELERHAEARRWRAALEAAQRFIEAFPDSVDAQAVRATMPTIEDNARIEEVREMRDYIRDLIKRRRYAAAVEVARDLIARFPDTVAARELNRQLGRLNELARNAPGQ